VSPFVELGTALRAAIPQQYTEIIALTVCSLMGCEAERIQHERLCERLGYERSWIHELIGGGKSSETSLTSSERVVRELTVAIVEGKRPTIAVRAAELLHSHNVAEVIACIVQVCRFSMVAMCFNALEVKVPVKSIFDAT
jgi:hypothetical protein